MTKLIITYKGGSGSGHHGHRGRPGEQGGSLPGDGGAPKQDVPDYEFKPGVEDVYRELVNSGIEEFSVVTDKRPKVGGFGAGQYIKLTYAGSRKIDDLADGIDTIMRKAGFSHTHNSSGWSHYKKGNVILSTKRSVHGTTGNTYKSKYTIANLG